MLGSTYPEFTVPIPSLVSTCDTALACSVCGSQLGMKYAASPGTTYISVTSLDKPDMFPPIQHSHWPDRRPWLALADALPKHDKGMTEARPVA